MEKTTNTMTKVEKNCNKFRVFFCEVLVFYYNVFIIIIIIIIIIIMIIIVNFFA